MGQIIDEVNNAEGKLQSYKCETYDPSNIHPENIQTLKKINQKNGFTKSASLENNVNFSDKGKGKIYCNTANDDKTKNGRSEHLYEVEYPVHNNAQEQEKLRKWLQDLNKKLEFLYVHSATELVLDNDFENEDSKRICDPYGFIRNDKILEVKNIDAKKVHKIQGKCAVTLKNGDECEGNWRQGMRMGKGTMIGPTLERLGISHLFGNYENGVLTGKGRMSMLDNSILEGWFQHGYLHGPAKGTHSNGKLSWVGWFQAGLAVGTCWQSVEGDAWLVGKVDKDGRMTGDEIAFLYPDLSTALLGTFEEGVLVSAVSAFVDTVR